MHKRRVSPAVSWGVPVPGGTMEDRARVSNLSSAFAALRFGRHDESSPMFSSVDFGVKNGARRTKTWVWDGPT